MLSILGGAFLLLSSVGAPWSEPAVVEFDRKPRVTYRAQVQGRFLVVSALHAEDWHTYAMDNDIRANEKLAGKPPLGIELPTKIEVAGATTRGSWLQTTPDDMSKPELRWYRWGFSEEARFAIELDPTELGEKITVNVQGQACDAANCIRVDLDLAVEPVHRTRGVEPVVKALIPVRPPANPT